MRPYLLLSLALSLALLSSCGGSGSVVSTTDVVEDQASADDVLSSVDSDDPEILPADGGPDLAFDTSPPDILADIEPACEPGQGCFLDPCDENVDCLSGWCVEHMADGVCSQTCLEECPPGWSCKLLGNSGPDPAYACVSNVSNLCKPCAGNADCKSPGAQEDVCVAYGAEGSFCGGGCSGDDECPWGFSCLETFTVDGIATLQCVADTGLCPCSAKSVTLALWTPCSNSSDFGLCEGKRVCTEEGLTACDAGVAGAEVCNGLDDDCDGDVDDPNLERGEILNLCDDGNPCTVDSCLGVEGCQHEALDAGECVDGDPCTMGDHCEAGVCVGSLINCDDNDPCTDDACGALGGCTSEFNTADCDDGNACTVSDECDQGVCVGFPVNCDCQVDGDCVAFEDGDLCNGTLYCDTAALPYQCTVDLDTVVTCPPLDGDEAKCNAAVCDADSGACVTEAFLDGVPCDDGEVCTVVEACLGGSCQGGVLVNCNDGNPCTDDACDPSSGCVHVANSAPCEDGDVCSAGDFCDGGICKVGQPVDCDDGNPCTADSCVPGVGCVHDVVDAVCDDGNACTLGDHCAAGACVYEGLLVCDDDNFCTTDTCDPAVGCSFKLNEAPCDDGDLCTLGDHCHLGECISSGVLPCDDGNFCTTDVCDPDSGCGFSPNALPCDDGDACNITDTCVDGVCVGAGVVDCDDDNLCTDELCDPDLGCQTSDNSNPCDDGDPCTLGDTCADGVCVLGAGELNCNDGVECTADSCEAGVGCVNSAVDEDCDDGVGCTADSCHPDLGCVSDPVDAECDDDLACTIDACDPELGCLNTPLDASCEDGNECTDDTCDPDTGCVFTNNSAPCQGEDGAGVCQDGVCVSSGGQFQGFVTWSQTATSQSDAVQDGLMNSACAASYPGSHAASIDEIIAGQITGLPGSNTSGDHLLGVCPNCEGTSYSSAVSGHARKCVDPGAAWPTSLDAGWNPWCHTSSRTAMCIL